MNHPRMWAKTQEIGLYQVGTFSSGKGAPDNPRLGIQFAPGEFTSDSTTGSTMGSEATGLGTKVLAPESGTTGGNLSTSGIGGGSSMS